MTYLFVHPFIYILHVSAQRFKLTWVQGPLETDITATQGGGPLGLRASL